MTYDDFEYFIIGVIEGGLFAFLVGLTMIFIKSLWCGGL